MNMTNVKRAKAALSVKTRSSREDRRAAGDVGKEIGY